MATMDVPTYDPVAVAPFRQQLNDVGFSDLLTPEDVDQALAAEGVTLVVLNSVCGCSAGSARPGVGAALQNVKIPDHLVAMFAGQEKSAVSHFRTKYIPHVAASSPNIALFKDGQFVAILERAHIQQMDADDIAEALAKAFDELCTKPGPSIPLTDYQRLEFARSCGSKIARVDGGPGSC